MNIATQMTPWMPRFAALAPLLDRADGFAFDLDGTLVDNEGQALDLIRDVINTAITAIEPAHQGITSCYRHLSGKKLHDIIAIAQHETGIDLNDTDVRKIVENIAIARRAAAKTITSVDLITPMVALAQFIKDQGKPVCVVTASEIWRANQYISAAGIEHIFEGQVFASNLRSKTDTHREARLAMSVCRDSDIAAERWVVFEDSPSAVVSGIEAGAAVIAHNLCTHISPEHTQDRITALHNAHFKAMQKREGVHDKHQTVVMPLLENSAPVIGKSDDIVPVLSRVLNNLPERVNPTPRSQGMALNIGGGQA